MKPKLFRPTFPFYITQHFDQNEACIEAIDDVVMTKLKIVGKVDGVCPVGYRELYPLLGLKGHPGLDIHAPDGTPLYACGDGQVISIQTEAGRGIGFDVVSNEEYILFDKPCHIKWRYWHLKKLNVYLGQRVFVGDVMGWADSTGFSAGSHLHFEVKPVVKNAVGEWVNMRQGNGYFGAIDFEPYLSTVYALDAKKPLIPPIVVAEVVKLPEPTRTNIFIQILKAFGLL